MHSSPFRLLAVTQSITVISMVDLTTVCVKFHPDDLAVLKALEEIERLKRSDIVRRAIRAYAKQLGVQVDKPRKRRRR